jgi:hypothetical protein
VATSRVAIFDVRPVGRALVRAAKRPLSVHERVRAGIAQTPKEGRPHGPPRTAFDVQGATLDTVHLSRRGHALVAEAIWDIIR